MIKPIILYGDSILRQRAQSMCGHRDIINIIQDLKDTLYKSGGVGLAAPQIGISRKIFIINIPDEKWEQVFINPIIELDDGKIINTEEACLSIPGLSGFVPREEEVTISYYDEYWKFKTKKFRGIKSIIIQHEYDHLNGILWIDRVPEIHDKILPFLQDIKNNNLKI